MNQDLGAKASFEASVAANIDRLDWQKSTEGLLPAVIQDVDSKRVLMLGYMDRAALKKTIELGQVTFFSRSKKRLWTKGESSGNFLIWTAIEFDCDDDTILIQAHPQGPTCHTGSFSCFGDEVIKSLFIAPPVERD